MNLHAMVRGPIQTVNPDIVAQWKRSTGYTKTPDFKQVPSYAATVDVRAQVQALSSADIKHMADAGVTMQPVMRKVYLYGNIAGIVRADKTGGDLLYFPQVPGATAQEWLAVTIFETWPDWCAVGVALQAPAP